MKTLASAAAAAVLVAGGLALGAVVLVRLEPRGVRLLTTQEVWLLAVFTTGALAVLAGLAAWLGGPRRAGGRLQEAPLRAPEVTDGADDSRAGDQRPAAGDAPAPPHRHDPWERAPAWAVAVGFLLLGIYLVGWILS